MGFKRGNIVKFTSSFWRGSLGESQENVGKLGVIEYSYGERYGNGECYGGYCVMDYETGGSSSWWNDNQLEFVSEGGEDVINECKKRADDRNKKQTDINWIRDNWNTKDGLSAATILALFHKIGYTSSFERNGEYFCLYDDWNALSGVFDAILNKNIKKAIEQCDLIFKSEYKNKFKEKCIEFYNELWT